jgi:hypothetical protein
MHNKIGVYDAFYISIFYDVCISSDDGQTNLKSRASRLPPHHENSKTQASMMAHCCMYNKEKATSGSALQGGSHGNKKEIVMLDRKRKSGSGKGETSRKVEASFALQEIQTVPAADIITKTNINMQPDEAGNTSEETVNFEQHETSRPVKRVRTNVNGGRRSSKLRETAALPAAPTTGDTTCCLTDGVGGDRADATSNVSNNDSASAPSTRRSSRTQSGTQERAAASAATTTTTTTTIFDDGNEGVYQPSLWRACQKPTMPTRSTVEASIQASAKYAFTLTP